MAGPGGGRMVVEQPYRTPPAATLLDAADLVAEAPTSDGANGYIGKDEFDSPVTDDVGQTNLRELWLNGVTYKPEQAGVGAVQYVGCGYDPSKTAESSAAIVATDPFLIFREVHCSALGWESAEYVDRARRALASTEAYLVEREFMDGAQAQAAIGAGKDYPADQWVASSGATILNSGGIGGAAVSPVAGVALIHEAIAAAGGAAAMIHMPPDVLDFILGEGQTLIRFDQPNNRYVDIKGNRVVAGYGYSGKGPDGSTPAAGTAWVFTTGPVRYWRTRPIITPTTLAEAMDRVHNDISFRAERYYLVDWDRSYHFAVRVDLKDE